MELWIRSQDKMKLLKVNYIEVTHHYSYKYKQEKYLLPSGNFEYRDVQKKDKYIKSAILCNDGGMLGTYKTKERALQVLDEIQNILQPRIITHEPVIDYDDMIHSFSENVAIHCTQQIETELKQAGQVVYQMPEN